MKNKIGILSGLVMAGVLLLAGCSGVLDDAQTSGGATGTVLVEIGSPADARTLAPPSTGLTFVLGYTTKNSDKDYVYADASASKTLTLEPGVWNLSAIGYQDTAKTKAVAKGETAVTVRAGEAVTASILLSKAGDVNEPGFFAYDVVWTGIASTSKGLTQVELKLSPADAVSVGNAGEVIRDLDEGYQWATGGNPTDSKGETMTAYGATHTTGKIPLPAGVYDLDISVTTTGTTSIARENTTIHRKEKVYIYSYLTTEAPTYTFTELDIAKVILRGSRPILRLGLYPYNATSSEIWSEPSTTGTSRRLAYSTGNSTTETNQTLTYTGTTWELYLAGYQLEVDAVNPSTTVYFRTRWDVVGEDIYLWQPVKIELSKQIFDGIVLNATGRVMDRVYRTSSYGSLGISTPIQTSYMYSTQRSAMEGHKINLQVTTSTYRLTSIEVIEQRIYAGSTVAESHSDFITSASITGGFLGDVEGITYASGDYNASFTMPGLSGTDSKGDYEVDPNSPNLVLVPHYLEEGDVIRAADVNIFDVPSDTLYLITDTAVITPGTFPHNMRYTILEKEDQTTGSTDGLYSRYLWGIGVFAASETSSSWGVPDILELSKALYATRTRSGTGGGNPGNGTTATVYVNSDEEYAGFVAEPYWSSSQAQNTTASAVADQFSARYVYRNGDNLRDATANLTTTGTGFNKVYDGASRTTDFYTLTTAVGDANYDADKTNSTMQARVRRVKNGSW
jgi:hypothetical protein